MPRGRPRKNSCKSLQLEEQILHLLEELKEVYRKKLLHIRGQLIKALAEQGKMKENGGESKVSG